MILEQWVGPFAKDPEKVTFTKENVTYLQLGVEYPHSIPLSEIELKDSDEGTDNTSWPIKISINKGEGQYWRDFVITDKDILELKLKESKIEVIVHGNDDPRNKYLIINAAYETAS